MLRPQCVSRTRSGVFFRSTDLRSRAVRAARAGRICWRKVSGRKRQVGGVPGKDAAFAAGQARHPANRRSKGRSYVGVLAGGEKRAAYENQLQRLSPESVEGR